MSEIIIIGGGASGLVSGITLARKGKKVTILEKNTVCGKKILATGNGRCNYFNEDQEIIHYRSQNQELLENMINKENLNKVLEFFESIGIVPKIKNGYYYPFSNQAVSIQNALLIEARNLNINIETEAEVYNVKKENDNFIVITNKGNFISNKVILATGSKASFKGDYKVVGYDICKKFGHSIITLCPALVQLKGNEKYFKDWNGIRVDVKIDLFENNDKIAEEIGEIQLTDYGISGICVMNLSGRVSSGLNKKKNEYVRINFLECLNINSVDELIRFVDNRHSKMNNRTVAELLEGIINYKLLNVLLRKSGISLNKKWNEITYEEKSKFAENLVSLKIDIVGTNEFDKAQVCLGGIPLSEVDINTMESKKEKGLYIIGELLDVDADCGGYNLTWAWVTGILSGENVF